MKDKQNAAAAANLKGEVGGVLNEIQALARAMPQWISHVKQALK